MITNILMQIVVYMFAGLMQFFPVVTLASIPIIGDQLRLILIDMVGYWNSMMEIIPHLAVGWNVLLYVIIPFEIGLVVLKFFLGSRTPINHA